MVIVRLSGGLGNQLFQYAFGRALAIKRNEELFIDDFSFRRDRLRCYELQYYPINANRVSNIKRIYYNTIFLLNRKINIITAGVCKYKMYFEKEVFSLENLEGNNAEYFHGCWQNVAYFADIKEILRKELTYSRELPQEKQRILDEIRQQNMVAIHVRHGDYMSEANQKIYRVPSPEYYQKSMAYLRERQPDCRFLFFSDDIEWCKEKFGRESDCLFIEEIEDNSPQEDMYFMQQCKHFIIANSSFSWWAAWLGPEDAIKIAPKSWYHNEDIDKRAVKALLDVMEVTFD